MLIISQHFILIGGCMSYANDMKVNQMRLDQFIHVLETNSNVHTILAAFGRAPYTGGMEHIVLRLISERCSQEQFKEAVKDKVHDLMAAFRDSLEQDFRIMDYSLFDMVLPLCDFVYAAGGYAEREVYTANNFCSGLNGYGLWEPDIRAEISCFGYITHADRYIVYDPRLIEQVLFSKYAGDRNTFYRSWGLI